MVLAPRPLRLDMAAPDQAAVSADKPTLSRSQCGNRNFHIPLVFGAEGTELNNAICYHLRMHARFPIHLMELPHPICKRGLCNTARGLCNTARGLCNTARLICKRGLCNTAHGLCNTARRSKLHRTGHGNRGENICWRDVRGQRLFGELISVHPLVPFLSMHFICCGRLILGRLETFITPMHMFTVTRVEAFDDRQHAAGGQASALSELPCLHLPSPKSTSHNCRCPLIIPRPRMRAGGRLLELRRLSLRRASLRHHVLHLESVAEAEDSVEMQPCKTARANIAAVFLESIGNFQGLYKYTFVNFKQAYGPATDPPPPPPPQPSPPHPPPLPTPNHAPPQKHPQTIPQTPPTLCHMSA